MFLLNTISGNPDSTGPTSSASIPGIEQKITELEKLLGNLFLNDYDPSTEGYQPPPESEINTVKNELLQAREQERNILSNPEYFLNHDFSSILNDVKSSESTIETSIKELTKQIETLKATVTGENSDQPKEIKELQEELDRMTTYQKELSGSDTFWGTIIRQQDELKVNFYKDDFLNGTNNTGGYNRLLELESTLKNYESGKGTEADFQKINEEITRLRTELISKIPNIKDTDYFKEIFAAEPVQKFTQEQELVQKKVQEMEKALTELLSGSVTEIKIGETTYKDIDSLKAQLLKTNSYLQSLGETVSFYTRMESFANTPNPIKDADLEDAKNEVRLRAETSTKTDNYNAVKYQTMLLEAVKISVEMGIIPSFAPDDLNLDNSDSLDKEINTLKEKEAKLKGELGLTESSDANLRLSFETAMNNSLNLRIADLEKTKEILDEATRYFAELLKNSETPVPDSYYHKDPYLIYVTSEIERLQQYKQTRDDIQTYWEKIVGTDPNNNPDKPKPEDIKDPKSLKSIQTNSRTTITNLRYLFDIISDRESLEMLEGEERRIIGEIEYELGKAKNDYKNHPLFSPQKNPSLDKVTELRSSLRNVLQLKSHALFMSQLESSVKESISKESVMNTIYSQYSS